MLKTKWFGREFFLGKRRSKIVWKFNKGHGAFKPVSGCG